MQQDHRQWQRETALKKVSQQRDELLSQGRPYTDKTLAEFAATYVGATADQVLLWMGGAQ